jgi:hypothetical protein
MKFSKSAPSVFPGGVAHFLAAMRNTPDNSQNPPEKPRKKNFCPNALALCAILARVINHEVHEEARAQN